MDFSNNNFFNHNMNPYFTPTSFDSDNSDPAMYNMNQPYCRVGIIRLNMTHIPNLMTIIFKIISALHRVNGDSPPWVKISTTLSTIFIPRFGFISSFSYSTSWGKIQFGKEYGSHAWVLTTNSKFAQFTILPKSNSIYSFSRTSNWRRIWAEERLEVFCEKLQWFQNILDPLS